MLFNAPQFLFAFLPATWIGFRVLGRIGHRAALAWLVVMSLVFYGWWHPRYVPLLVGSVAFNYLTGEVLRATVSRPSLRRAVLSVAISANLGLLVYYKYLAAMVGFLIDEGAPLPQLSPILLPLGISFFTFTQIAYLVDVATGQAEERDPIGYAVFVTFFPHLVAGPILHHSEMMPQFRGRPGTSASDFIIGIVIFTFGLAKKNLLADPTSLVVAPAFAHPEALGLLAAWQATLSYSLQLYFDFSGYSDMAIGLARMFGIRFPLNFNSPYKARSVIEYWQRWHMTLTRYLTQYLFNPLAMVAMRQLAALRRSQGRSTSRNDRFLALIAVPLPVTMVLAGVWHGAGLQFLVFGSLHGVYLTINHAWRTYGPRPAERSGWGRRAASVLLTYVCVLTGSVFFRAPDVPAALAMCGGLSGLHGVETLHARANWWDLWPAIGSALWLVLLYVLVWTMPNTQEIMGRYRPALRFRDVRPARAVRFRLTFGWALLTGVVAAAAVLLRQQVEFVYFQF